MSNRSTRNDAEHRRKLILSMLHLSAKRFPGKLNLVARYFALSSARPRTTCSGTLSRTVMNDGNQPPQKPRAGPTGRERPAVITSQQLMQGRRELWIDHEGEIYRLRITSRGKLYLTK